MEENLRKAFARYGREVRVREAGGSLSAPFHAFIQPLRYKNKMYLYGVNTEIGYNSQGYYLYIGPPEQDLRAFSPDARLESGGTAYQPERAETVAFGEETLYVWASLRTVVV